MRCQFCTQNDPKKMSTGRTCIRCASDKKKEDGKARQFGDNDTSALWLSKRLV